MNKIHGVHFGVPEVYSHVVKQSMDSTVQAVDRTNAETKLRDFLTEASDLLIEMRWQEELFERGLKAVFSGANLTRAKDWSFLLTLIINFLLFMAYSYDNGGDGMSGEPVLSMRHTFAPGMIGDSDLELFLRVLGMCQVMTSGFVFVLFMIVKVPPGIKKYQNPVKVFIHLNIWYYGVYCAIALMGVFGSYHLFTLHLMDIIIRDRITRDVLNSVVMPRWQLAMTLVLMMMVLYIYATITFLSFPADLRDQSGNMVCTNMANCFIALGNFGIRRGGGIGDDFSTYTAGTESWFVRQFFFDMSYFFVVIIILLNVIFGIIIDTFGDLRTQKNARTANMMNVCFICNLDRNTFERNSIEFRNHIAKEHNMWDYLKYIVHIREKEKDDYNGLEDYVFDCLSTNKIDWFPVGKATCLDEETDSAQDQLVDMFGSINETRTQISHVSTKVTDMRKQLDMRMGRVRSFKNDVMAAYENLESRPMVV